MSHWTEELFVEHADHYAADLEANTAKADGQVTDLLDLLADEHEVEPDDALDVGCGVGRHAVPLAERGLDADGVDISPEFLARARQRAVEAGMTGRTRFVEGDMCELRTADLRENYDLVTCFFTSFGYYDEATNREVLAVMADRVAPGGALVLEVANKEGVMTSIPEVELFEDDCHLAIEQRDYDPASSRIETTRRMFEKNEDDYDYAGEATASIRLYAPVELKNLLSEVGLAPSLYGDCNGAELVRDSARFLAVGRA